MAFRPCSYKKHSKGRFNPPSQGKKETAMQEVQAKRTQREGSLSEKVCVREGRPHQSHGPSNAGEWQWGHGLNTGEHGAFISIDLKALFTHLSLNVPPSSPKQSRAQCLPQNAWLKITLPKNLAPCGQGCDAGRFQNTELLVQLGYQPTRTGFSPDNFVLSPFCHLAF